MKLRLQRTGFPDSLKPVCKVNVAHMFVINSVIVEKFVERHNLLFTSNNLN